MYCPKCGTQQADENAFCSSCGAAINAASASPTPPSPQQPTPSPPSQATPPAPPQVSPPLAPPAPAPSVPHVSAPVPTQPSAPPPVPTSAGKTILRTLLGVLVVAGIGVGGYFAYDTFLADKDVDPATSAIAPADTSAPAPDSPEPEPDAEPIGWTTPEDALAEQMPHEWVSVILTDDGEIIEYAIGPPNSEYADVVVVARQPDGSWLVENVYVYDMGDMGDEGDPAPLAVDEAALTVQTFITAVAEDRADDAHLMTVSPFSEDPASASFSNGDLLSFTLIDAQLQSDGSTVLITVDEDWVWDVERYIYTCVPTADGYRISEVAPL